MGTPELNAQTRREWRDLGFFYEVDHANRCWTLVGSRAGLAQFADLLRRYVADPRRARISEHEHYGPYMYLKVMTWTEPKLDDHAISGRPDDLARLASMVSAGLVTAGIGGSFTVGSEYAPLSDYELELRIEPDGFDPASADRSCADNPA